MENKQISGTEVSEQNKEALQSEIRKEARNIIKTEISHFTDTPEILDFEAVKVSKNDGAYGIMWGGLVRDYLKTAYSEEAAEAEIVSENVTYKVLKRGEITAFYDAYGNTLFDVENKRLDREYNQLMNITRELETGCHIKKQIKETGEMDLKCSGGIDEKCIDCDKVGGSEDEEVEKDTADTPKTMAEDKASEDRTYDNVVPMGKVSLKEIVMGLPAPTAEEIASAKGESAKPAKQRAKEKLEKELKATKDKSFAEPIIGYLLKRCEEDEGVAEDVAQEHKTWDKCFDYIYGQARKQATGNRAAVRDDVVYEWTEDYYHKDDKAEEAEKARKEEEAKAKREKAAAVKKATTKKKPAKTAVPEKKEDKSKEQPKPKKNSRDMEGQLDMFSMMGM